MIFSLVVVVHYGHLAVKAVGRQGGKSTAWDSPLALFLLALQAPERYVRRLRGAGVRVTDTTMFCDMVRIEEGDDVSGLLVGNDKVLAKQAVFTVHSPDAI